jgi:hypothetical protein
MKKGPFMEPMAPPSNQQATRKEADFDEFEAVELYCPKCGKANPVRKFLLLILPEGDKYEYRCQVCGTTVGDKIDHSGGIFGGSGN